MVPKNIPKKPSAITQAVVLGACKVPSLGSSRRALMVIATSRYLLITMAFKHPKADLIPPPAEIDRIPKKIAIENNKATFIFVPPGSCAKK
jgi:hypothetical protein